MSNCWTIDEHHYAHVFTVSASFKTYDPPLWNSLLSPSARSAAFREDRGQCRNCHEGPHTFQTCRHPFINAGSCLNPELGELGIDNAFRRRQARMTSYRRDGKYSRPRNYKEKRRYGSNQSRGNRQDQGHVNNHGGNHRYSGNYNSPYTPGIYSGIPPTPASSAPMTAPGRCIGAAHSRGGNPNARQPGIFNSGN